MCLGRDFLMRCGWQSRFIKFRRSCYCSQDPVADPARPCPAWLGGRYSKHSSLGLWQGMERPSKDNLIGGYSVRI